MQWKEMRKSRDRLLFFRRFQFWFIFRFTAYTALYLSALFVGLFLLFRIIVNELLNLAGLFSKDFVESIHSHSLLGLVSLLGLFFVLVTLSSFQAIFMSRRIGGPIYAFTRHLEECGKAGQLKTFKLREGDLFTELADKFNSVVQKMDEKK
jgi:hypothetical protein